ASSIVGGTTGGGGSVRLTGWPRIENPFTNRVWSWKPRPPPKEKAASPLTENPGWSWPSIGTLTATLTLGIETSTRPLGCSLNVAGGGLPLWPIVMIPPALRTTFWTSTSVIRVLVVNGMATVAGLGPCGSVVTSV